MRWVPDEGCGGRVRHPGSEQISDQHGWWLGRAGGGLGLRLCRRKCHSNHEQFSRGYMVLRAIMKGRTGWDSLAKMWEIATATSMEIMVHILVMSNIGVELGKSVKLSWKEGE